MSGDCDALVEDDVAEFRAAAIAALDAAKQITLAALEQEHALLASRLSYQGAEAIPLWTSLGVPDAAHIPDLDVAALRGLGVR